MLFLLDAANLLAKIGMEHEIDEIPCSSDRSRCFPKMQTCWKKTVYKKGDVQALLIDKSSNRSALTIRNSVEPRACSNQGMPVIKSGEIDVTESCIRYAIRKGILVRKGIVEDDGSIREKSASQRSFEDCQSKAGVTVKREIERAMTSLGKLDEAASVCPPMSRAYCLQDVFPMDTGKFLSLHSP